MNIRYKDNKLYYLKKLEFNILIKLFLINNKILKKVIAY